MNRHTRRYFREIENREKSLDRKARRRTNKEAWERYKKSQEYEDSFFSFSKMFKSWLYRGRRRS